MKVSCSQCGEEIMGAVNRCWRCGKSFPTTPGSDQIPPIRRPPISVVRPAINEPSETNQNESAVAVLAPDSRSDNVRRGSPFASGAIPQPLMAVLALSDQGRSQVSMAPSVPIDHARDGAAGGAVGSLFVGLLALVAIAIFPIGALLLGMGGLLAGVWGLHSNRKGLALAAMILCCSAIGGALFRLVLEFYQLLG